MTLSKAKTLVAWASALLMGMTTLSGVAEGQDRALSDKVQSLEQQIEELKGEIRAMKTPPAATAVVPAPAPAPAPAASAQSRAESLLAGVYGTLDVSFDYATKGLDGKVAYPVANGGLGPGLDYSNPKNGGAGPVGRVGWLPAISTNKSQIGYRGSHVIGDSDVSVVYQVETSLAITASPGLKTSWTQQSNVVQGAVGLGDTFVGVRKPGFGTLKFGTTYSPYKRSTDRLNPFSGMLGDYAVIMGNTGGDNRVEFGTRLDHSIEYDSPKIASYWNFNLLVSPGQNRTYDNVIQSAGSPDCNGGNQPGSGNLLLKCDDGGFGDAYAADIEFEYEALYATIAYELHKDVNRNSDGIGANNPQYARLLQQAGVTPNGGCNDPSGLLDCATYQAVVSEFPNWASVGGGTPPYLTDIGDEAAFKVGAQYRFGFGLTASGIWEHMTRNLPQALDFQNERQRDGTWFALTQNIGTRDTVSAGWGHAGKTPGDPGGQHNYNPLAVPNTADLYTIAWKHRFDKQFYWYADWALTINHGNAHYDLGAGGRGLTTDCHDGTNTVYIDNTSAGPTTWGGCRVEGVSTGINYKF